MGQSFGDQRTAGLIRAEGTTAGSAIRVSRAVPAHLCRFGQGCNQGELSFHVAAAAFWAGDFTNPFAGYYQFFEFFCAVFTNETV